MLIPNNIEALLRLLLSQAEEHAIIFLDTKGCIVGWLAGAESVFGYTADEIVNTPFSALFTPEDLEKGVPQFELDVANANCPAEDDRWMLRKDGLRFWATGVLTPLRSADASLVGYAKILRNRTDLKQQLESLENRLSKLQKAAHRQKAFIGTLAHELRNPLGSISNALELLNISGNRDEQCVFARSVIRRQLDFMQRLIDDLMEITRIDAGKVQLTRRVVALQDILTAATETCRPQIDLRTHNLKIIATAAPMIIDADPSRLQQVFVNLIQNAAKYTHYGGHIWVKLFLEGREAVVKIEDDGIGISAEMLPEIFELFTQAEFRGDDPNTGLGIGLSVVKDLVTLHGGTVQVRSDGIGKGSEFTVRLPLAGPDAQRADSADGE
jgi:PAS domain S-box-containing protein